jgi:hypothetical protein
MGLDYGSVEDISGMSLTIFQAMDEVLSKHLLDAIEEAEGDEKEMLDAALRDARENWRKLAYCIAKGVIDHIASNMEVCAIRVKADGEGGIQMEGTRDPASPFGVIFEETGDGIDYVA